MSTAAAHDHQGDHGHGHDPHLAHHFDSPQQQFDSGKLGIWLFLVQEILFFSGLFCAYAVYRSNHPEIFEFAHRYLDVTLGAVNTVVLICSSLTAAWSVRAAQLGQRKLMIGCIVVTIACAFGFLGIKYVEYQHKFHEGLLWGEKFNPKHAPGGHGEETGHGAPHSEAAGSTAQVDNTGSPGDHGATAQPEKHAASPAVTHEAAGDAKVTTPRNTSIFFSIYFAMTGLHGLHVIAGIIVYIWLLWRALKGEFGPKQYAAIDFAALYWHLVDLVWIYLFPLLYLIR
ncbi:MAG: cytochrome c oxidase subunit 3 family protein [Myxococcota bacterium]